MRNVVRREVLRGVLQLQGRWRRRVAGRRRVGDKMVGVGDRYSTRGEREEGCLFIHYSRNFGNPQDFKRGKGRRAFYVSLTKSYNATQSYDECSLILGPPNYLLDCRIRVKFHYYENEMLSLDRKEIISPPD